MIDWIHWLINGHTSKWSDECVSEWTNDWNNEWMKKWRGNNWMNKYKCMTERLDRWMDGRMTEWVSEGMNEWIVYIVAYCKPLVTIDSNDIYSWKDTLMQ